MYLTLIVEGATPDEIARGLDAAQAVFDRAGVTALQAADARFAVEGWDIGGFEGEISGDDLAICTVWDEAQDAERDVCCQGWSEERREDVYLELVSTRSRLRELTAIGGVIREVP